MRMLVLIVSMAALIGCARSSQTQPAALPAPAACEPANAGLTLPAGFCASIAADTLGRARHLAVAANGDVYVATASTQQRPGGIVLLRDSNGDGVFESRTRFGEGNVNMVGVRGNFLYAALPAAIIRYRLTAGQVAPAGAPDTLVRELPTGGHSAKTFAFGRGSELFVKIGSRSNSCQVADRQPRSPGHDPCTELETRAGIWLFDAEKLNQRLSDGVRYATGLRNVEALATGPDGALYGANHGRDGLQAQPIGQWTFSNEYGAENPAEIFVRISRGDDYGWPYCYNATELKKLVLAPEYGGDGTQVGRCAEKKEPLAMFPGHWAPNGLTFYTGSQFPARYRNGAFIAFHGSWNRAPLPQAGFNVTFLPLSNGTAGRYEVFADGFRGSGPQAAHRPMSVAVARDGSLLVSDDAGGRLYRIRYTGK